MDLYEKKIRKQMGTMQSFENCKTIEEKLKRAEANRDYWKLVGNELSSAHWDGVVKGLKEAMELQKWTPVSEGFPDDNTSVLVTYNGYCDGRPYCDDTAYRLAGEWYWSLDDSTPVVEITAWKPLGEPYKGE